MVQSWIDLRSTVMVMKGKIKNWDWPFSLGKWDLTSWDWDLKKKSKFGIGIVKHVNIGDSSWEMGSLPLIQNPVLC